MSYTKVDPDVIKVFLKVREPDDQDKKYYTYDLEKQVFILHDPIIKTQTEKSQIYEMDKIFNDTHENSYIYEEICRNALTEALAGTNYTFIGYGEASSDKQSILFGQNNDSSNIAKRGIFPRFIEAALNSTNTNEKLLSLSVSYMCINDNRLIDLSNYMGRDISKLTEEEVLKDSIEIKTGDKKIIQKIKKIPTENANDGYFYINQIFNQFEAMAEDSKVYLYSKSHYAFICYFNDNNGNLVSAVTFLMLSANEQNAIRNESKISTKKLIQKSKNVIKSQFTFESIISAIGHNNTISKGDIIENEDDEKGKLDFSYLTTVLYSVSFSPFLDHIKFRIVGAIEPNTGFYESVKDTLMFLFTCKKIIRKNSKIVKAAQEQKETEKKKEEPRVGHDDVVYELENKLKLQEKSIQELNERIEVKDNKIKIIQENYKKQIEVLKQAFGFVGDVNILMSGDQYTKEAVYARGIRDAKENLRIKTKNIKELEEKLEVMKDQIKKYKTINQIKENDATMVKVYNTVKKDKEGEERQRKFINEYTEKYDNIKKEYDSLMKINEELRKENQSKTNIIMNFQKMIEGKGAENLSAAQLKSNAVKQCEKGLKKEIADIRKSNQNEIKVIHEKYESILKQKELSITGLNNAYSKLSHNYDWEVKRYNEELVKLNTYFENLCQSFKSTFNHKKNVNVSIVEYTTLIRNLQDKINNFSFPLLFRCMNHGLKYDEKNEKERPGSAKEFIPPPLKKSESSTTVPQKRVFSGIKRQSEKEPGVEELVNVVKEKKKVLTEEELEKMSKEELISFCRLNNKKIEEIEDFANKYAMFRKGYNVKEFTMTEEHVNGLYLKIDKLEKKIKEQVDINNKNKIILTSQDRSISQLKAENALLHNKLTLKNNNDKISFPVFTTNPSRTFDNRNFISIADNTITRTTIDKAKNKIETTASSNKNTTKRAVRPLTAKNFKSKTQINA